MPSTVQLVRLDYMEPKSVGAFEAKTHFSRLLEAVQRGEVFYITRHGKPVAELRAIRPEQPRPTPGIFRGKIEIGEEFDAPLEDFADYRE